MSSSPAPSRPALSDLPWLVPLGLVVLAGSWFTNAGDHADRAVGGSAAVAVLCAAVAVGSLFVGLRAPVAGVVGNTVGMVAFVAAGFQDGPIYLTLGAMAFVVASRRPPAVWLVAVLGSLAAVSAALAARVWLDDGRQHPLWQLVAVAGVVAAGVALGTLVRGRDAALQERARRAVAEEQLRMAQDLHDGVGHGLAVIAMQAGVALHVLESDQDAVRAALVAIKDTSREALDALRLELSELTGEPAARGPRRGLDDLDLLVDRVRATGVGVTVSGSTGPLPEEIDAAAYAIVQEALTNVLRHADARAVTISLTIGGDRLTLVVADDGTGAAVHDVGMGLRGMRERAASVGGSLVAGPRPVGGFEVRAELPLEEGL
jgi:signal transduction histidine kinase